jgi:hypothetical protein
MKCLKINFMKVMNMEVRRKCLPYFERCGQGGVQSHFNGNFKNFNRIFALHNDLYSIFEDTLGVWELRPVATW